MNCLFGFYLFVGQLSCQKMHGNLPSVRINYATRVSKPGIYFIHSGGMILANRFLGMNIVADWIEECDAVCVFVECKVALENPHPAPIEDCYAGLKWVGESLAELQSVLCRTARARLC